jgi:hypothetical protein
LQRFGRLLRSVLGPETSASHVSHPFEHPAAFVNNDSKETFAAFSQQTKLTNALSVRFPRSTLRFRARSEGPVPAINVEMCMAQHLSVWAQTNRSLRSTPMSTLRITTDKVNYVKRSYVNQLRRCQRPHQTLQTLATPPHRRVSKSRVGSLLPVRMNWRVTMNQLLKPY